ncbi:MAG: hypothetical protein Q4A69_07375 [Moraxella sp.]|nr:hypothetical protein [Moraxella sp.]
MLWLYILAIVALHITLFGYIKKLLLHSNKHGIILKNLPFYFWLIGLVQIVCVSLLIMNIMPIKVYDEEHIRDVFATVFFITNGLVLFSYFGRKHHLLIKLSAISTASVLYLHGLILSDVFASLFNLLF